MLLTQTQCLKRWIHPQTFSQHGSKCPTAVIICLFPILVLTNRLEPSTLWCSLLIFSVWSVVLIASTLHSASNPSKPMLVSVLFFQYQRVLAFDAILFAVLLGQTLNRKFCQCCVELQCFAQQRCSQVLNLIICFFVHIQSLCLWKYLLRRTTQAECGQPCVDFQCLAQCACSFNAKIAICLVLNLFSVQTTVTVLPTVHVELFKCCISLQGFTQSACCFSAELVVCLMLICSYSFWRYFALLPTSQIKTLECRVGHQCLTQSMWMHCLSTNIC